MEERSPIAIACEIPRRLREKSKTAIQGHHQSLSDEAMIGGFGAFSNKRI
jgi:hypothetical protein